MVNRRFFPVFLVLAFGLPWRAEAQSASTPVPTPQATAEPTAISTPDEQSSDDTAPVTFAKPYEYERQAYGYDPEGVQYKENEAEDFQVIFISSLPFTALGSFLVTSTASLAFSGKFSVNGDYFIPFVGLALGGSTAISCVSVLSNRYPAPPPVDISQAPMAPTRREWALRMDVLRAEF